MGRHLVFVVRQSNRQRGNCQRQPSVFNAVVWIMRTGCPWADLPERFGKVDTVRKRFRRLAQQGVWQRLLDALQAPELEWVMLDSTVVRAHQHSAGQKNSDPATECLGRSRGGVSTKIHACVESLGNAVRLIATEGQAGDSPQALPLLADLAPGKVLAETAYDSDATRDYCAERGIEVVIPSHPNRTEPHRTAADGRRNLPRPQQNRALFWALEAIPPPGHPLREDRRLLFGLLAYRCSA